MSYLPVVPVSLPYSSHKQGNSTTNDLLYHVNSVIDHIVDPRQRSLQHLISPPPYIPISDFVMPPVASFSPSGPTVYVPKVVDYTAVSPSEVMIESVPEAARMQPFLVVGISLITFIVMLMITMIFSVWQWRRHHKLLMKQRFLAHTKPGSLYYRRLQRKRPIKKVRWQSVVYQDSPPNSATHLLNDEYIRPIKTTSRSIYGSSSTRRQIVDTPPPYSKRDLSRLQLTPYRDVPSTATTIDSQPMSGAATPPPPVPKKSARRPPPLTLIVISPTDSKHHSSIHPFERQPTPYPKADQLTPVEDEDDDDDDNASTISLTFSSSPILDKKISRRPKLTLKTGDALKRKFRPVVRILSPPVA